MSEIQGQLILFPIRENRDFLNSSTIHKIFSSIFCVTGPCVFLWTIGRLETGPSVIFSDHANDSERNRKPDFWSATSRSTVVARRF